MKKRKKSQKEKKKQKKKQIPKLELLQPEKDISTPEILKPLYDADEKLREYLQPKNIKKEAKELTKYVKYNAKKEIKK